MMKANKLLGIILILLISFVQIVFAQNKKDGLVLRPVIEYSSGDLRDPFNDLFYLEKKKDDQIVQAPEEGVEQQEPLPSLDNFKVKGVIWGGKFPLVIINDKMLKVGDLINDAEIVSITKEGIVLNFSGRIATLVTPGNVPVSIKGNKEEK